MRKEGGVVMSIGSRRAARASASWTSWAAASMLRPRSNCRVIWVEPSVLLDEMVSMPAMVVNSRSSGAATDDAMMSGAAPGRVAVTVMIGKSTRGKAATGSWK